MRSFKHLAFQSIFCIFFLPVVPIFRSFPLRMLIPLAFVCMLHRSLLLSELDLSPRPPCNAEKCCFHSDKVSNVHFVHTTSERLKTQQSSVLLNLCLIKTRSGNSHDYHDYTVFRKLCFYMLSSTQNGKVGACFQRFLWFEGRFRKASLS